MKNEASSTKKKTDALAVLMTTAKKGSQQHIAKKRRRSGGSFVDCPAGCGKQVLESLINVHLDRCPVLLQGNDDNSNVCANSGSVPTDNDKVDVASQCNSSILASKDTNAGTDQSDCAAEARESPSRPTFVTQDALASAEKVGPTLLNKETPNHVEMAVNEGRSCPTMNSDVSASTAGGNGTGEHRAPPMPKRNEDSTTSLGPAESSTADTSSNAEEKAQASPAPSTPENAQSAPSAANSPRVKQPDLQVPPRRAKIASGRSNVFSVMMERSKILSAKQYASSKADAVAMADAQPIQQCLYLSNEGLNVTLFEGMAKPPPTFPVVWSAVVVLKDRHVELSSSNVNADDGKPSAPVPRATTRRPVELTIATNVPSADATNPDPAVPARFVRHHSRLSVPVLKSILQKSIRRRRPLPSVRVAMELADKSLGDLVRRLPVIAVEDSTLHPDLDLLVWLMVAHSKDYVVPTAIMTRLFQIVFEVASCQWKDDVTFNTSHEAAPTTAFESNNQLSLNTLHLAAVTDPPSTLNKSSTSHRSYQLVWSLLVRAEYGGMRCDLEMLHRFARLWQARFHYPGVPTKQASRWGLATENLPTISWRDVLHLLHERARAQCADRVIPLVTQGIPCLVFEDLSVEGVDFHCSPIVDHLLCLPVAKLCSDLLVLSSAGGEHSATQTRNSDDGASGTMPLQDVFRHCLWHYSSGVNRRQPLLLAQPARERLATDSDVRPDYKEMWRQLIAKEASRYQSSFVRERLARIPN